MVADYDLNVGHLLAFLKEFFEKTGHKDLRFKPAYNPYTEVRYRSARSLSLINGFPAERRSIWVAQSHVSVCSVNVVLSSADVFKVDRDSQRIHRRYPFQPYTDLSAGLVWRVPTRNAGTDGITKRCSGAGLGHEFGTSYNDQVCLGPKAMDVTVDTHYADDCSDTVLLILEPSLDIIWTCHG